MAIPATLGHIQLSFAENSLVKLTYHDKALQIPAPCHEINGHVMAQLSAYFDNPHHSFHVSFHLQGTLFQIKVWNALCKIPVGSTMTYGELAKQLNSSPRAIGQACKVNPIPIIIPCHRIIARHDLGGYNGHRKGKMVKIKEWLLQHERAAI